MSKAHLPPIPPANRTHQGPEASNTPRPGDLTATAAKADAHPGNTAEQGAPGNLAQNTTHTSGNR